MRIKKFMSSVAFVAAITGAAFFASGAQASSLIVNGGFETGDFAGWTVDPTPSFPQSIVITPVNSGTFAAGIAGFSLSDAHPLGPDTLTQVVTTTLGQSYELSFARRISNLGATVSLDVTWDGTTIFSELNPNSNGIYETFTFSVVGTGSDTLRFIAANDPSQTFLDDVSLTSTSATPLPSTWLMLLSGFAGVGFFAYRGTKKRTAIVAA